MSIQRWPAAETKFSELKQLLPHRRDIGSVCFEWLSECNCDGVWDSLRQFPEKFSTLKRKDRAPELVEPCRNDERIGVPRDQFVSTVQAQKRPRAFKTALRENAHDLARSDFLSRSANCRMRMAGIDRNAAKRVQKPVQNRFV